MTGSRFLGLTRRMKRIAEAYQAKHPSFVRHHACDPSTKGFSADQEPATATDFLDCVAKGLNQQARPIGRSSLASLSPPLHVWKFESDHPYARRCHSFSDALHERRIHRRARAMRKQE